MKNSRYDRYVKYEVEEVLSRFYKNQVGKEFVDLLFHLKSKLNDVVILSELDEVLQQENFGFKLKYDKIRNIVKKQAGNILENIELFDIYVFEKGLLEYNNKKSVSISMVFRDSKKTLEENIIVDTMDKILKGLEKEVGAVRR